MSLTQKEYEHLMVQEKAFEDLAIPITLGPPPQEWTRKVFGIDTRESFLIDYRRRAIEVTKYTFNKRYRQTVILLRYDAIGRHTNPDGVMFDGPHVHLYREGYDDKFAFTVSIIGVDALDDISTVFQKVALYCNISQMPSIYPPSMF